MEAFEAACAQDKLYQQLQQQIDSATTEAYGAAETVKACQDKVAEAQKKFAEKNGRLIILRTQQEKRRKELFQPIEEAQQAREAATKAAAEREAKQREDELKAQIQAQKEQLEAYFKEQLEAMNSDLQRVRQEAEAMKAALAKEAAHVDEVVLVAAEPTAPAVAPEVSQ